MNQNENNMNVDTSAPNEVNTTVRPAGNQPSRPPVRRLTVKRTVTTKPPAAENGGQRTEATHAAPASVPHEDVQKKISPVSDESIKNETAAKEIPVSCDDDVKIREPKQKADTEKNEKTEKAEKKVKAEKPKKQKTNRKKARKKTGVNKLGVTLWIVMILALVVGIAVITIFLSGNKQVKEVFRDGDIEYSITYFGKYDEAGNILEGTLSFSDNQKADIKANGDGTYTVNYSNGSVYVGKFDNYHRNGTGTLTFKNGDVYEGSFHYDRMWGNGTYKYQNGDIYEGEFKNNKKHGTGKYTFTNGDVYEGSFENDLRNGYGKYTYSDGSVYEGEYKDNKRNDDNASMTICYEDGTKDVYIGSFVNDSREGHGCYTWASGDSYEGNFSANNINGHGIYKWASGRSYEGEFLNGNIVKDGSLYPTTETTTP